MKKLPTFASAIEKHLFEKHSGCFPEKAGPFVYRLGRKIFILERGVRFPHGLLFYFNSLAKFKSEIFFQYSLIKQTSA